MNKQKDEGVEQINYLFVVTPDETETDDSWEGSIKQMSKLNQQYMDLKCESLTKQIYDLSEKSKLSRKETRYRIEISRNQ